MLSFVIEFSQGTATVVIYFENSEAFSSPTLSPGSDSRFFFLGGVDALRSVGEL